jgi:dTDP-4-dehydrorhamnose 3,5-epimerase
MTLNIIVPIGEIRFVFYDDRKNSPSFAKFHEVTVSERNYCRLTVPPMMWMAFQGSSKLGGTLLNIADIIHDPSEVDRKNIDEIDFNWQSNQKR